MKTISLTKGQAALVDDEDYEELNEHSWCAVQRPNGKWYATRTITHWNRRTKERSLECVLMHRVVLQGTIEVDHRDGNGLNNQRANLRPATRKQNGANRGKFASRTTSRFKGVSWNARARKWQAGIKVDGKSKYLGSFGDEVDAARAYNRAAGEHFGAFARPNTIE